MDRAGRMVQKATELRNRDAKYTEFVQSLHDWSGRVGEQLEPFGKQQQTDKIREVLELIRYQHSLDVEIRGIQNEKRRDQGKGSQETPSAASLCDLAKHSIKTLQDLANWFDRLQEGKGTEEAKAPEWQGKLQGLRKQWELAVQQPSWSVLFDGRDSNIGNWRGAHREPAEALYESRDSDIPGGERQEPIAVMGMACRLPEQASSPAAFWQMLIGKPSVSPIPSMRWKGQRQEPSAHMYNEDLKRQDARFNKNLKVTSQMDPQHRLFLETAHEAIEDAEHAHDRSSQTPCDCRDRYSCTFGCGHTAKRCVDWKLHEETYKINGKYHFLPMEKEGKQSVLGGDTMQTYQGSVDSVYHFLFSTAFAVIGAVCAVGMDNYDHLYPRGHLFTPKNHTLMPPLSRLSSIILSPSPPIFVAATLIHGIATLSYYHSRPGYRYQEWFLTAGIIGGTIIGLCVGADMKSILLGFLPLMLIVSLVLYTGLNLIWDCYGSSRNHPSEGGEYGNAFQAATARGEKDMVELLVKEGADINAQDGEHSNTLQAAATRSNEELVKLPVKAGADVNTHGKGYGNTLQATAAGGKKELVNLLVKEGVDVNADVNADANANANAQDIGHRGAFYVTTTRGEKDLAELLVKESVDVKSQGGEYSDALQAATARGKKEMVELLVKEGADIKAQGEEYSSTVQAAATRGDGELVKLIVKEDADVNA